MGPRTASPFRPRPGPLRKGQEAWPFPPPVSAWEDEVQDPVCGERFPPALATFKARHKGRTFHFCSRRCLEAFEEEPERYAPRPKANS